MLIEVGVALAGHGGYEAPDDKKVYSVATDFIKPEVDGSMWYFWGMARRFRPQDAELTDRIREGQGGIFSEDLEVLERQQQNLEAFAQRKLLKLNIDAGGVGRQRARRALPSGLRRAYTLCRPPNAQGTYAIAVLKDPRSRGGSHEVHAVCQPGMALRIDAPLNLFPLQVEASEHILVAGGIGITPMRAMAHTLGDSVPWRLHHFVRDRPSAAYADELLQRFGAERVRVHPNLANGPDFTPLQADLHRAAAEESIVQALGRVGVHPMVSCEQGVCGTCLTRVLGGVPEHRDGYLSDDERACNDQMLICCSRARRSAGARSLT